MRLCRELFTAQDLYSSGIAIVEASTVYPSCSVSHKLAQTAGIQGHQALNKMNETILILASTEQRYMIQDSRNIL